MSAASRVSVGTSPTLLHSGSDGTLVLRGGHTHVWVGPIDVAVSSGLRIGPYERVEIPLGSADALYAVALTADVEVQVLSAGASA